MTAAAAFAIPGVASADCTVQNDGNGVDAAHPHTFNYDAAQEFSGSFAQARQGDFVQVPFNVPAGTTGIRIRYCYDGGGSTLDMGVYEPLHAGDTVPGPAERRGWSGSAVRDLAISKNGFSPKSIYDAPGNHRKDLVEGYTTRAYQPGAIPAGQWTAELGLAFLANDPVAWRVRVETSNDSRWGDSLYAPATLDTTARNPNTDWYAGDVHAHGEGEPGNALLEDSLAYAFTPLGTGGAGLDFLGLVDHNNTVNRNEIGRYQSTYPNKLIIPGTEVTTYKGHYNAIGSSNFADFRGGSVYRWDPTANAGAGALGASPVKAPSTPASQFPVVDSGGGWSQINHPTIFQNLPAVCRGCFWNWSDTDTDYSKVDAIELQTGPADIVGNPNPYTTTAIAYYEGKLAAGNHIAAVGSSDSHMGGTAPTATDSPIGRATTMVYADQLSQAAVVQAVKDQHTYVKLYGNDGPNINVIAHSPGAADARIGDDLSGPSATVDVNVTQAGATATRPGTYSLELLKDGVVADTATITSDNFNHSFTVGSSGRYSFEVIRADSTLPNPAPRTEVYSSPIWFSKGTNLKLSKAKVDKKKGTAKLPAKVTGAGKLKLSGSNIKGASTNAGGASTKTLTVKATGKAAKDLKKKGKAKVTAKVTFTPTGGDPVTATQKVTLKKK